MTTSDQNQDEGFRRSHSFGTHFSFRFGSISSCPLPFLPEADEEKEEEEEKEKKKRKNEHQEQEQ